MIRVVEIGVAEEPSVTCRLCIATPAARSHCFGATVFVFVSLTDSQPSVCCSFFPLFDDVLRCGCRFSCVGSLSHEFSLARVSNAGPRAARLLPSLCAAQPDDLRELLEDVLCGGGFDDANRRLL